MNLKELQEKYAKELIDAKCCKVCQCENGKKLHCACHRKQIAQALEETARVAWYARGDAGDGGDRYHLKRQQFFGEDKPTVEDK